jgi:transposase
VDVFVGIDVSQKQLDIAMRRSGSVADGDAFRVGNDSESIRVLVERLQEAKPTLVVMEASGGYERDCAAALILAKVPTAVVNPRQVRDFAGALGKQAKTDSVDAAVLARFGEAIRPAESTVDDEATQELRGLIDRRAQLVEMRSMEMNRKSLARLAMRTSLEKHINWLTAQIKKLDRDIDGRIKKTPAWLEKAELLETAMGIARTTSAKLIVDLPELGKVSHKRIAALVGTAPYNDDSGAREGRRHCKGGRKDVRTALYMPTLTAIRHDPKLRTLYARLVAAGKEHKVALIACMRKLIITLNAMVRDKREWTPS